MGGSKNSIATKTTMGANFSKLVNIGLLDLVTQVVGFIAAYSLQTEMFYDFTGSITYIGLVLFSFLQNHNVGDIFKKSRTTRSFVNSSLVVIWAVRLGSFLLNRVTKVGKDSRFDKVKTKWRVFLFYWLIQGLWVFLTALPVYFNNVQTESAAMDKFVVGITDSPNPKKNDDYIMNSETQSSKMLLEFTDYFGWGIWLLGFVIQVTADRQKSAFRSRMMNKKSADSINPWIDEGIWHYSQHPNYFGEILMWCGIYLSSSTEMTAMTKIITAISPIFVTFLLTKVSGIPLLRKANLKKWGHLPEFQKYLNETSQLIPLPKF